MSVICCAANGPDFRDSNTVPGARFRMNCLEIIAERYRGHSQSISDWSGDIDGEALSFHIIPMRTIPELML
jgi:hypothetical protein